MCGIDDRGDLVARHVARGTALETVSGTGDKLDRLCAAADFLTNLPAQCFRSVDEQVDAGRLRGPTPIRAVVEIGGGADVVTAGADARTEEHTTELQSLMRNSYAVFSLKIKTQNV